MRVTFFQRKPYESYFSIERLFDDIRSALPDDINFDVHICRYFSRGIIPRILDSIYASRNQGDINHITGDVHFLTYFMKRSRTILTLHDCVMLEKTHGLKYWLLWFFWYWLPIKRSGMVTVISESTRKAVLRHMRNDHLKIAVIPNCVSPEFTPVPFEFNDSCPRILQVGTNENKNLSRVVAALRGIPCNLAIIGHISPFQLDLLRDNEIKYENYTNLTRTEIVEQYGKADILMFASLYEGFGLPILEAHAVGRPVITSTLFSMPDVAGDGACYVDPYQIEDIRKAVLRIIKGTKFREQLIDKGFQNIERFRPRSVAAQYSELYRRMLEVSPL